MLGEEVARDLISVVAEIEASENAAAILDLWKEDCEVVDDEISLRLDSSWVLKLVPNLPGVARTTDGTIEWESVMYLQLQEIGNY